MTYTVDSFDELPLCGDICRLCLQSDEILWNIFEAADSDGVNLRLSETIIACLDIMVVINDGLPDLICAKCMTIVRSFFEFRKQCKDNDTSLRKCFLTVDNKKLQTETSAISNSPPLSPKGIKDSIKQCDQAAFLCTERPNNSMSPSVMLGETPDGLHAVHIPLLKQLEDEWSDDDPSATCTILQEDTVTESPWRLEELAAKASNSSLTVVPTSLILSNQNLDSCETNCLKKCSTDSFTKTAQQKKERDVLTDFNSHQVLADKTFLEKSIVLTNKEDCRSEQTCQIKDSNTLVPNDEASNFDETAAVAEEILAGRVSRNVHGKWVCTICNKSYTRLTALKKHILVHYSGQFICTECPALFDNEEALSIHKVKHSSSALFLGHSCQHCFKMFHLKSLLEQHIAAEHVLPNERVPVPEKLLEKCGKCAKNFNSSIEAEAHDESCGSMSNHSEENIPGAVSTELEPLAESKVCNQCGLNFENMSQLTYHFKKFHNEDPTFKCELCAKVFGTYAKLSDHRSKVHIEKHTCEYCHRKFREKTKLRRHLITHEGVKLHKCDLCGKSFRTLAILKSHHNTHTKPFQCGECSKTFRCKYQLNVHENVVHLGIKDFMCDRCGEKFLNKTRLKSHIINSMQNNLECSVCAMMFCVKQKFERHAKLHIPSNVIHCKKCDAKFLTKKGLCSHMRLKHPPS